MSDGNSMQHGCDMDEKIILAKAGGGQADRRSADASPKAGRKPLQPIRPPGPVIAAFIELAHKLAGWAPARLEALKRGDSLAVAKFFTWAAYEGRKPGDESQFKRARFSTGQEFGFSERTVETHISRTKEVDNGRWWSNACRQARKRKYNALMKL
jgi:hypothetical protein